MDLAKATVAQVMIPVESLDSAIPFYRDTLGIPFLFSAPPQMSFFQAGAVRLLVGVLPKDHAAARGSAVYFQVDDIQGVYDTLTQRGVKFGGAPHAVHRTANAELLLAEFQDPDGNPLALMGQRAINA